MLRFCSCIAVCITMFAAFTAQADVWYVDADSTNATPNGTAWCSAFLNLRDAITVAASGDEIRVADGTYWPDDGNSVTPGDRTASFHLNSGVQLRGGYAGCDAPDPDDRDTTIFVTILSGDLVGDDGPSFTNRIDNSYHVVLYNDASAVGSLLEGFTIESGYSDGTGPAGMISNQGPAIHIRDDTTMCIPGGPTIRDCIIRDNWSSHHGAVNVHADAAIIEDCEFHNNHSGVRGGGLLIQSGNATVRDCLFVGNTTDGDGGGVWAGHSTDGSCALVSSPTFTRCTFEDNAAFDVLPLPSGRGGGMFHELNNPTIVDCTLSRNTAPLFGGGIHSNGPSISISGCQFIENTTTAIEGEAGSGAGGGAWLEGLPVLILISDCMFERNQSQPYGGGLALKNAFGTVRGCAFLENRANLARGGGLRNLNGNVVVANCEFDANQSGIEAGGLSTEGGGAAMTIYNSHFRGNTSQWGGAVRIGANGTLTVVNTAFTGNSASRNGGAIRSIDGATSSFTNCTFAGNWAGDGNTIGLWSFNAFVSNSTSFVNCVIWNDSPRPQVAEVFIEDSSSVTMNDTDVRGGWAGGTNMDVTPDFADADGADDVFGTPDDNTRLMATSPLIDTGNEAALPLDIADLDGDGDTTEPVPFDLDGQARIVGVGLDLGSFEWSGGCPPGQFSDSGSEPCTACPAGTFQPAAGAMDCIACEAGTSQPSEGATQCEPCVAGTFSSITGSTLCQQCLAGTSQPAVGATECLDCDANTFQPEAGQATCFACSCADQDKCTIDSCDSLSGECFHEAIVPCAIPASSTWGLIVMALLLAAAATIMIGRRFQGQPYREKTT